MPESLSETPAGEAVSQIEAATPERTLELRQRFNEQGELDDNERIETIKELLYLKG